MQKIEPHNLISISENAIAHILRAHDISDFTYEALDGGIENTSIKVDSGSMRYVLRIYRQDRKNEDDIAFELSFQDYLRDRGIPIPRVHRNTHGSEIVTSAVEGKQWRSILMEFVEGRNVTTEPTQELLKELAGLQAKMHLLGVEFVRIAQGPATAWTMLKEGFAQTVDLASIADVEVKAFLQRSMAYSYPLSAELPHGYNHLDVDIHGNVITDGDTVRAIIDFDDVQYSPPVVCLGFSLWSILSDVGVDSMRVYLKAYEKIRPLSSIERETLMHVLFFRNYIIGTIRLILWPEKRTAKDIEVILRLEKEIPELTV